ncbi:sensor histidine kinase [Methylobacterium dankookense]|uniref:histidine kinase n=1 Tax=Methylobacterium dankookense TaxID=560405 RepID=A0A564FYJ5_9HYPH|nr:cache domain-containing protein [Methylobacterium dankookense]GJD57317.1 Adaptive-response sensory-kinase SasA [Methylobacterium dankookense]VUF13225.1 Sensor protein ZraS [Methylobacterium dankookense]
MPSRPPISEPSAGGWGLRSVRVRLLAIALLPMVAVLPVVLGFALFWWLAQFDALLVSKAHDDLIIARQYLRRIMERGDEQIAALGQSAAFAGAARAGGLDALLEARRTALGLDFLYLTAPDGTILAASPAGAAPSNPARWQVVATALAGRPETALDILESGEMAALSPDMAARARLDLVPTPAAAETDRTVETRGLVIHSASPAPLADGRSGALVGGSLLNGNLGFVDTINELIYAHADLPAGSQGTATLFLGDVRVATNVRLFGNRRALGTRVSREVRDAVLGQGRTWLDSAFVVNDRYISAYEPVADSAGRRVGMLYVGFLERPFRLARWAMVTAVIAAFAVAAIVTVPFLLRLARAIFQPLERMNRTIAAVDAGDLGARTGTVPSHDEIGLVARRFDELLDRLEARDAELRAFARELDARVEERTRQLEETRRQLVMSEKLASIGEITAGVAHEINNPIAVIQGNLEVAREALGPAADEVRTEFDLIDQQVYRVNMIVTRLLQFARPDEYAGYVESVVPAAVVADCLVLVRHLLERADVTIESADAATRTVEVSPTELQQVVINLMVNAIHAMPQGGLLRLTTADEDRAGTEGVAIAVADTGVGIPPDRLRKVFDPFFTTRTHGGTGLGLSISYTLMARYGGMITVESEVGRGSVFTVWLPAIHVPG